MKVGIVNGGSGSYSFRKKRGQIKCFHIHHIGYQGCGNTEMVYLSPGKLSEKSYLSG